MHDILKMYIHDLLFCVCVCVWLLLGDLPQSTIKSIEEWRSINNIFWQIIWHYGELILLNKFYFVACFLATLQMLPPIISELEIGCWRYFIWENWNNWHIFILFHLRKLKQLTHPHLASQSFCTLCKF